ncbi:probable RNA helicase armi [Glossina fuscipes]|uniref:Probable RNA helicase armi n=1 Tax=Glossina fuscipes TaxID=7396 RepID=A0A9C5ZBC5_9MUSC|nr:probable RNA helicase armi [Glossina fuscipes]XP_037897410.1 probable RNA helicase armi [Glossina fuscipes]XP_037897411.1 probable RNA helicase armi [Glossina fuscipes]
MLKQLDDILPQSPTRHKTHGVFFCGMRSKDMQVEDSPFCYKPYEAKDVFLMTVKLYRKDIKPKSIGIITPFVKQAEQLRDLFVDVDVAKLDTVEEF